MPTLYLVGTPIGNLEDITYRAVRILGQVALVAAEDTRTTRVLFQRYGIKTPLTVYHEQGAGGKQESILQRLEQGDVALVSEAGMPSVSDPGFALVRGALEKGYRVEAVPGPSAVTTAIAVSGLPSGQFLFLGFLPRTATQRRRTLASVAAVAYTLVVLESPHRLRASLADIHAVLGDRRIAVCRELTKLHEEVFRGTVSTAIAHFEAPRGEVTLVVEGQTAAPTPAPDADIAGLLRDHIAKGLSARDAITLAAKQTGRPRREVYKIQLDAGKD